MVARIFFQFLLLGLYSFGGPAAHFGYFRRHFVDKLKWIDQNQYAQFIAMSQVLPGPGSSQVGFAIGHHIGGTLGALAAFIGFTLPSALIMIALAIGAASFTHTPWVYGAIAGLKLLALVVVIDAVIAMFKQFCQRNWHIALAVFSAAIIWLNQHFQLISGIYLQLGLLVVVGLVGSQVQVAASNAKSQWNIKTLVAWPLVFLFVGFIAILVQVSQLEPEFAFLLDYFRAGATVFGGGHVVLPMLGEQLQQVPSEDFITAYAAAQAMPGPMFTMASFLGASATDSNPWLTGLLATVAIFAPGLLLMLIFKSGWQQINGQPRVAAAIAAINASVVGLLIAAAYNPIFTSAIQTQSDLAFAVIGLFVLRSLKVPVLLLVAGFVVLGVSGLV